MKNFFLIVSAIFFSIVTVLHFLRFIFHWPITVGPITIDSSVSIWGALVSLILAAGCFIAYKQAPK